MARSRSVTSPRLQVAPLAGGPDPGRCRGRAPRLPAWRRRFRAGQSPCFSPACRRRRSLSSAAPDGFARRAPYSSVAVLPFTVDGMPNAYLADGLVEGVINGLTRLRDLRVTPRASAFRFKDAIGDPVAAGRALDVAAVVTGSLSRSGDGVRLQVELVDVARNAQAWSTAYQVAEAELPQLETRVIRDLARAMRVRWAGADGPDPARPPTGDAQAYQAYLQGRYLWNQRSEASLQAAIGQFRRAIELDPGFALAHAALADAHTTLGYLGYVAPVGSFPIARPYALKALELDPSLAQAHASLAYIKFYFDWDWVGARQEFMRAIELNPNDPVSHQWYAVYLLASGHPDLAFGEVQIAHRLDPLSLAINTDIGFHHYYNGRYDEAVSQLQSVLTMKSDFLLAHLWLARALLEMRRFDTALAETAVAESQGARLVCAHCRARLHLRRGRHDERGASRAARNGCAVEAALRHLVRRRTRACRTGSEGRGVHAGSTGPSTNARTGWFGSALIRAGRTCTRILDSQRSSRGSSIPLRRAFRPAPGLAG